MNCALKLEKQQFKSQHFVSALLNEILFPALCRAVNFRQAILRCHNGAMVPTTYTQGVLCDQRRSLASVSKRIFWWPVLQNTGIQNQMWSVNRTCFQSSLVIVDGFKNRTAKVKVLRLCKVHKINWSRTAWPVGKKCWHLSKKHLNFITVNLKSSNNFNLTAPKRR